MRQGSNSKRPRGKGGNRGSNNGGRNVLSRSYDSNGPAGKVRGNPHQVHEKYLTMARDAQAEDPILAENLMQHADHYFRIIAEATGQKSRKDEGRGDDNRRDDQSDQDDNRPDDSMDGNDSRSDDNRGNAAEADGRGAQGNGDDDGAQEAPKRTRRPRRAKTQPENQESSSEEVASDAA